MNATLLELPINTPETSVSCANCPAVQRLERALAELRADFYREVGYWKSRHADPEEVTAAAKHRLQPPSIPRDVADHRLVFQPPRPPTFHRHPIAGVNLLPGNSLR